MFGKAKTATFEERRQSPRRPVRFAGKIVNCDASRSFDCMVVEISNNGAKIEIRNDEVFPEKFFLLHSREWVAFEAELIWRGENVAGLHILHEHDLANNTDPQMAQIKFCSVSRS